MLVKSRKLLQLHDEIQEKRATMIQFAELLGYTHIETIKCSQELDQLIFKYQQLMVQEKEARKVKSELYSNNHFFAKTINFATIMI